MKSSTVLKTFIRSLFLASIILSSIACSKKTGQEKHIPDNAAVVAVLDVKRMTLKAFDMSLLLEENILNQNQKEEKEKSKKVPIEESGIDFLDKSYIIGHVADNEADNYMGVIMPISDPSKFREFALSYAIKKPGEGTSNVTYVIMGEGAILGWNNESAIYLLNQNVNNERALTSELFRLYALPESNQMFKQNESFQLSQEKASDISVWMDINKLNKYRNPLGMIIPGQRVSKGIYNAWINFEKGETNIETTYYVNEDESEVQDGALVLKESVDSELLKGIKTDRILGSFNLGLNIPLIKDQMRKDGMLDSSQTYLDLVNTTTEEFVDMLSGDLVSVLLEEGNNTHFFMAFGIKHEATCNKIINSLSNLGLIRQYEGYYSLFNDYFIYSDKKRVCVSSDENLVKSLNSSQIGVPENDFLEKMHENPLVLYLDLKRMPKESYYKMKNYWKNWPIDSDEIEEIYFTQSSINKGTSNGEAYIKFRNKEKNSLTIIAKSLKRISRNIES